jgi:hypothetical protein
MACARFAASTGRLPVQSLLHVQGRGGRTFCRISDLVPGRADDLYRGRASPTANPKSTRRSRQRARATRSMAAHSTRVSTASWKGRWSSRYSAGTIKSPASITADE